MGGGGLRLGPLGLFFFIPKLNRFGLVRVGRFRHTKTGNRTEPDIFLNILTGSIGFFIGSVFSGNCFPVFSVKSVFRFFCSPLRKTPEMRWGRVCKIWKIQVGNHFFFPLFYSEFWNLKGWRINFHHYQHLVRHYKSIIKFRKTNGYLSRKTNGYLKLISPSSIIFFNYNKFPTTLYMNEICLTGFKTTQRFVERYWFGILLHQDR